MNGQVDVLQNAAANRPVPTRVIVFLAVAAFASSGSLRICDTLLPLIARDFGVSTGEAAAVVTGFSIAYGLVQAVFGPIGDRFGKFKTILFASLAAVVMSLLCAHAETLDALVIARIAAGAAGAAIIPLSMAWIGDTIPYHARQPVLARFLTGQILGIVFGQAAGGVIGDIAGWRAAFVTLAVLFTVAVVALGKELRTNPLTRSPPSGDTRGVLATFVALVPVLSRDWVRIVLVTVFLEGVLMFGSFAFVGAYLHSQFGLSFGATGALLAIYGAGGLSYTFLARRLVSRLGEGGLSWAGGLLMGLALAGIALAPMPAVAGFAIFSAGLGFYMLHNTLQTNATQMAPDARGAAVAFFASSLFLGQAAGVAVNASLIDRYGAAPGLLLSALGLPLVGLFFSVQIRRKHPS
jgi:MFS transporter, YNFM family, putative membrane transport protein